MVIIYTNENNPAALKLLIAKNVASTVVELKIVNPHDRSIPQPKLLPCLHVDTDLLFFIPNAGICYFHPPTDEFAPAVYEWLEWEATILSPNLAHLLGSSSKSNETENILLNAFHKLNEQVKNKCYIVENILTSADIAIWSIIYPLYKSSMAEKYLLADVMKWMQYLERNQHFKDAVSSFKIETSSFAYAALLVGARYMVPVESSEMQRKGKEGPNVNKESPQHFADAVTDEELKAAEKVWGKSIKELPELNKPKKVVLPVAGEKNVFITSALPYVNNVPHLGNIIGCVLSADCFARYSRLCNNNTFFICGTDEYGTATETKALEEGLSCQEICDKYYKVHNEVYKWFNISFDQFGRTSYPEQTLICQDMFLQLNDNGFMFTQSVEQLHCEKCDRYLADRFVEGGCPNIGCNYEDARGDQCDGCGKLVNAVELKNPRCKICKDTPKLKHSNQFFIDLPKLEPLLHHWMKISLPGWSNNAQVIAKAWMKEGLKPRCITRDLKWGVPVPLGGFRSKVFYVWFDALIGYLSISKAYTKDYQKWWQPAKGTDIKLYQFMAKDNVPFHSVLFPAMLLGANRGYVTVSHIMATEYLNYEDGKFSKSRGVGVFGTDAQTTSIPSDVWRFYLLYVRPESQDSSFSWNDLVTKNNSELLNNLGNFINRALMFAKNNFNKTVPVMKPIDEDYALLALCTRELKGYITALEKAKLRDGIRHILSISRNGNQFMQANQPWVLLKGTEEQKIRAGTIIGICCNLVCLLATLLHPYMPDTSESINRQLNSSHVIITPDNPEIVTLLPAGHKMGEPAPLFEKIEISRIEELKKKFAGNQSERADPINNDIKAIETELAKQADKVRLLKSSGADKKIWQPEVTILLDLKKKLEEAKKDSKTPKCNDKVDFEIIESEVAKQADKVRLLKSSGVDKKIWQPEVSILLDLKKKLEEAKKESKTPKCNDKVDFGIIESEVAKQADKVRTLKLSGVDKSVWQPEVAILLDLKKKLETAQKNKPTQPLVQNGNFEKVQQTLEEQITIQGSVVRKLKQKGVEKSVWQPEVEKLLAMKSDLAALLRTTAVNTLKSKKGKVGKI